MAKTVDKLKLQKYKRSRRQGKSKENSLIDAGLSKKTAKHQPKSLKLDKVGDAEIIAEDKITYSSVQGELNQAKSRAIQKGDSTNEIRVVENKIRIAGLGKEQQQVTNIYNIDIPQDADADTLTKLARRRQGRG